MNKQTLKRQTFVDRIAHADNIRLKEIKKEGR
jgi:hypothetical protein